MFFLMYWSEVVNLISLLSRLIRINPSKWGIMPTMMMLVERKTLGRTQQIMLRDDVWGKLGRFLRLHWDIGFVMSDICGEKCQDLRPEKSCLFLSGHHIFQDWNVMKIIQVLRVPCPEDLAYHPAVRVPMRTPGLRSSGRWVVVRCFHVYLSGNFEAAGMASEL